MKLEFEIHLVSWISIAVFRADSARFNVKPRQLRPFDTIDTYASLSASPSFEIHLGSSVSFVEVTADLAVERYSPTSSLSVRGESYPVLKIVLNSSESLSLGYFNVVSDYLKLFWTVISRIQVKIICGSFDFEQIFPLILTLLSHVLLYYCYCCLFYSRAYVQL